MHRLISSFSPVDKSFYEREFNFFGEVTSISGKLRPYIKKSKAEKKQKIDEELRKIKVDVGVYVPSNPDGVVIGIDRKSGRPLQSHAKAPFMATFRIKRSQKAVGESQEEIMRGEQRNIPTPEPTNEMWLSAIFKVGDDVRQDMLVLQIISAFRSIYNSVGLDVYVFPYRVLATAPGVRSRTYAYCIYAANPPIVWRDRPDPEVNFQGYAGSRSCQWTVRLLYNQVWW